MFMDNLLPDVLQNINAHEINNITIVLSKHKYNNDNNNNDNDNDTTDDNSETNLRLIIFYLKFIISKVHDTKTVKLKINVYENISWND